MNDKIEDFVINDTIHMRVEGDNKSLCNIQLNEDDLEFDVDNIEREIDSCNMCMKKLTERLVSFDLPDAAAFDKKDLN